MAPLPWLSKATDLEALAGIAQAGKWDAEQRAKVISLPGEIAGLMDQEPSTPTVPSQPTSPEPPIVEPGGKLARVKFPPAATRELTASPSTLMNVVRNQAQPGDHILLEDGDYDAGYLFDKAFPPDQKLVIRSKTPLGANFTVPPRFVQPGYWLHECRTSYDRGTDQDSYNIKIEANHINVTRCWIQGRDGIASRLGAIGNVQIGWNRFTGRNKYQSSATHLYFWLPLLGNFPKATDGPNNISIHYNFFDDPVAAGAEDHSIYFGETRAAPDDLPMLENVFIDFNFWPATNKRTRPLYLKRGCYVRRNTCLSGTRNFGIRHGQESKVWANIIRPSFFHFAGAMGVGATPEHHHDIRGNEAPNSDLILFCGSATGGGDYCAANYALAASNRLKSIQVGVRQGPAVEAAQGGSTKGCKILLDGKVPRSAVDLLACDRDTISVEDGNDGLWIPQTFPLDETKVGLETTNQGSS